MWRHAVFLSILFGCCFHVLPEKGMEALIAVEAAVEGYFGDADVGALK